MSQAYNFSTPDKHITDDHLYSGEELAAFRSAVNYYTWIIKMIHPYVQGHRLEVGAGYGAMSRLLLQTRVQSLCCLEPARNLEARLQTELQPSARSLTIISSTLAEFAPTIDERFESIVCINVLEHIQDAQQALQHLQQLLRPNDYLSLYVLTLPGLFGSLDVSFGHYRRYTKRRLAALARQVGFTIEKLRFVNSVDVVSWYIPGKLFHRHTRTRGRIMVYDRLAIPIIRRRERIVSPPLGQSLLVGGAKDLTDRRKSLWLRTASSHARNKSQRKSHAYRH